MTSKYHIHGRPNTLKSKILLTGGFGYIGARVAQSLAKQTDMKIYLGSRILRPSPNWLKSATPVVLSWDSTDCLRDSCAGMSTIIHLAAMNEVDCLSDPIKALEINTVSTARLVEAAKQENVKKLIYISTAHIYGSKLAGRIDENFLPKPISCYAISHRAAEDIVLAAGHDSSLVGIVARLSNGFGVPADYSVNRWSLLVNDLCKQAVINRRLVLKTSGEQRRDFITLTDASAAISHLSHLPLELVGDGIFNVGGAWAPTILEMAELVSQRSNAILGYAPSIHKLMEDHNRHGDLLDYRIDKLIKTGFKISGDRIAEIDATLNFCSKLFSTQQGRDESAN